MTRERFYNTGTQPTAADCLVDSPFTIGDTTLVVDALPTFIGIDGFSIGDQFRIKVEDTLYLVTSLGIGNVNWAVTLAEGSTDAAHVVGTGVYLDFTSGAIAAGIRDFDFLTSTDQTTSGLPNSVVAPTDGAAGVGSLRTLGTGSAQAAAGDDARLSDARTPTSHDHTGSAGQGGVLTNDEHDGYSEMVAISTPSTPASTKVRVYPKTVTGSTDLYYKKDDGTEVGPLGSGGGSTTFAALTDVLLTSPADGDVPIYNLGAGKWENGPQSGGGGVSGRYEIIVSGGGPPPDFLTTPDGTDYLYGLVP